MTLKELIETSLFSAAIGKIATDNLPDFNYKKVSKAVVNLGRLIYILGWLLLVQLGIKKLSPKEQLVLLGIILTLGAVAWLNKKQLKSSKPTASV